MNNNLSTFHSELPFPPIKVQAKNLEYASLLMNDYAGFISEFTSLSQYFYHYLVNETVDFEIANMLKNISLVETLHLDILGKLIKMLGGDPKYYAEENYWTADYITYGDNILKQLEADLQNELDAIANYRKTISQIQDPYIVSVLQRIILDEEVHVRLFEKAIEKVKESQNPKETLTDIVEEMFPNEDKKM